VQRTLIVDGELDLVRTLGAFRRGGGDPCMRLWAGECWRATRTPDGPATLYLRHLGREVVGEAWGPGAGLVLDGMPALLGLDRCPDGFEPRLPLLRDLCRRFAGSRIGRTGAVAEAMAPSILEQKVTSAGAHRSWALLVHRYGEIAPGPVEDLGIRVPPPPGVLASVPSWELHRLDVERKRGDTLKRAMRHAFRLDEAAALPVADAYARMQAIPGVGLWTAAEVAAVALGDPDAVSVGDFHLKHQVCWALAGEPRGTDERMLELLEPWRGHRGRVVRLLVAGHTRYPRRGPRLAHRAIARI
jgi:3-methyladenine DNA glycosylase/8-oxoguanine DNA glycosylase